MRLGINRYPGISFLGDKLQHVRDSCLDISADHFRPRRHYLMDKGIPELKDAADHLAFLARDQTMFFAFLQKFLNFHLQILCSVWRAAQSQDIQETDYKIFTRLRVR